MKFIKHIITQLPRIILLSIISGLIITSAYTLYQKWIDKPVNPRSYQIQLHDSTILVYDRDRYVGTVKYINTPLDSLILKDNQ